MKQPKNYLNWLWMTSHFGLISNKTNKNIPNISGNYHRTTGIAKARRAKRRKNKKR